MVLLSKKKMFIYVIKFVLARHLNFGYYGNCCHRN